MLAPLHEAATRRFGRADGVVDVLVVLEAEPEVPDSSRTPRLVALRRVSRSR